MARSSCNGEVDRQVGCKVSAASRGRRLKGKRTRELVRLADFIGAALRQADRAKPLPMFPEFEWGIVQTWQQNLELAQRRHWFPAAVVCRQELASALQDLADQASAARHALQEIDKETHDIELRDLYEELVALDSEFSEVEWDYRKQTLSVLTESIELDDMNLGPFKIVLDWSDLSVTKPYQIIAQEPQPAASDDEVTHPHVHGRMLCEGDGRVPIRNALRQGRLCDFFLLVQQVLQTYNAGSAYVRLEDWNGKCCADCGDSCGRNNSNYCDACEITLCSDCGSTCSDCDGNLCAECRGACHGCHNTICHHCVIDCSSCRDGFCKECLTDGKCDECRESDDDETTDAGAGSVETVSATPDAAVHSVCVGEVGVSA